MRRICFSLRKFCTTPLCIFFCRLQRSPYPKAGSVTLRLGVHERELFNREGASDAATAGGIRAERILSLAKVNSPAGAKAHQFTTERERALSG
jgi:hypothetical protein